MPGLPCALPRSDGGATSPGPGGIVPPGCRPGLPCALPRSDGGTASPGPGGIVAPGCRPGLPCALPRSKGEGETPAGAAVAPGGTRPGLPRAPGVIGVLSPGAAIGLSPETAGEPPPGRPAARVGGGMFFGFSVLIFCSSSALLATPAQPRSIFGCATFVFTAGGARLGDALASLFGAPTRSLFPWTFAHAPDLAAAHRS